MIVERIDVERRRGPIADVVVMLRANRERVQGLTRRKNRTLIRVGQKQPVRVVNFIAQGTIEEGMLSVLKFKKSLFAGVLDGGESTVFLGGSRLTRFMETVEQTTTAITGPVVDDQEIALVAAHDDRPRAAAATPDPWAALVQTGLSLLEQVAAASRASPSEPGHDGLRFVQRDPETGQDYLRIPMPSAEVLDRTLGTISQLLGRFKQ